MPGAPKCLSLALLMKSVHNFTRHFSKINFNIIFLHVPRSLRWLHLFRFLAKTVFIFHIPPSMLHVLFFSALVLIKIIIVGEEYNYEAPHYIMFSLLLIPHSPTSSIFLTFSYSSVTVAMFSDRAMSHQCSSSFKAS
jgi:hypothetical protein